MERKSSLLHARISGASGTLSNACAVVPASGSGSRLAAEDYDYSVNDFYEFIEVVPSAITELAHWQQQGYSLITPTVLEKKHAIEDIR